MRLRLFTILLISGLVSISSVFGEDNPNKLKFGVEEFKKVLSYNLQETLSIDVQTTLAKHFEHLQKRQPKYRSEKAFAEYSFYYIHKKLLKQYREYASLDQTLKSGAYDCVTATAMYALFFSELDVPFTIVETNYHLYILIFPGTEREVLLETTDPFGGFISDRNEVTERKELYVKGNSEIRANQVDLKWNVENRLKDSELIGLLLYNQSVKHYNLGNKKKAIELANEALFYYASPRIRTYVQFLKGNSLALR